MNNQRAIQINIYILCIISIFMLILSAYIRFYNENPYNNIIQTSKSVNDNSWKQKAFVLDSIRHQDSIKISNLTVSISKNKKVLERLKTIIIRDTLKIPIIADSVIRVQDTIINNLGSEAELYSRMIYSANKQIQIRDSVINKKDSIISYYEKQIELNEKKIKSSNIISKIKDFGLIITSSMTAILILTR